MTLFLHRIPYVRPYGTYEVVQFGISKILIFGVLSYGLILSSRNYLAHKHNVVVNRHRQDALQTFKTLVDAAKIDEKQDIVLTHAAEAIYSGRDTGFTKSQQQAPSGAAAVVQMIPRALNSSTDT